MCVCVILMYNLVRFLATTGSCSNCYKCVCHQYPYIIVCLLHTQLYLLLYRSISNWAVYICT